MVDSMDSALRRGIQEGTSEEGGWSIVEMVVVVAAEMVFSSVVLVLVLVVVIAFTAATADIR